MTSEDSSCDFLPGPRLSLLFSALLIVQSILTGPNLAFRDELESQFEATFPFDASVSSLPFHHKARGLLTRSQHRINFESDDGSEQSSTRTSRNLYSPSFWPHAVEIPTPTPNSTEEESSGSRPHNVKDADAVPTMTNFEKSVFVPLETFMISDGNDNIPVPRTDDDSRSYATCQYMDYQYAFYFPHLAQQLFRCWAFWRKNSDKHPAFFITNEYHWKLAMDNEFNRGLISAIQHAGVEVFNISAASTSASDSDGSISAHSIGPILRPSNDHFQVISTEDMATFRERVISSLKLNDAIPPSSCHRLSGFPRITIISRLSTRRIKSVKPLAEQIKAMYNLTYNVPVVYFEGAKFRNQVGAMANTDILITPHGAQEMGMVFMPQCGGVLELLPDEYFFPQFYGTLAATAGLDHAYLYLARNDSHQIVNMVQRDVGFLYPTLSSIQKGLDMLIERWQQCCNDLTNQVQAGEKNLRTNEK